VDELTFVDLRAVEDRARAVMRPQAFDYASDGLGDPVTAARAREFLHSQALVPRYLVDVTRIDLSTSVLGQPVALPVVVAPTVPQSVFHPRAEVVTQLGAASAGTIAVLGQAADAPLEDVAASGKPFWCELFTTQDRGAMFEYARRAEKLGCSAFVWTVDTALADMADRRLVRDPLPAAEVYDVGAWRWTNLPGGAAAIDEAPTWGDLDALRAATKLPIAVRGVLRGDDARRCVDRGANAVVAANHWGRLFDGAVAAVEVVPELVAAVDGRAEVLVEGGFRRGVDVLRAVALGAKAVLVGRPALWGLAVGGERGVQTVLEILARELDYAMTMCGVVRLDRIPDDLLLRVPTYGL
jgi:4-hydroxymandelate oxidase